MVYPLDLVIGEEDRAAWSAGLDGLFALVAGRFFRTEPRRRARAYVRGLLAPLAGKNGWTLAEVAGDATPDGMQRLLNSAGHLPVKYCYHPPLASRPITPKPIISAPIQI